jgi:copper homeostasis protein
MKKSRTGGITVEICVDSVASALAAQEGGASRVELCADLSAGGTTPSAGAIALARKRLRIPLHVMIRPRPGNFCYADIEFDTMRRDILAAKQFGADGAVFGILREGGAIDRGRTAELLSLARPLSVTFHRAFDLVADPPAALEDLIAIGVDRVLTSGRAERAAEGSGLLADLVRKSGGRIAIMAAGGIGPRNARAIVDQTGVTELHAGSAVTDTRSFSDAGIFTAPGRAVNPAKVRELVGSLLTGKAGGEP